MTPAALREVYDDQLRGASEISGASDVTIDGPVWRARFGRHGFVTARTVANLEEAELDALIGRTLEHFRRWEAVDEVEWKTRGHDLPADLTERLVGHGFEPEPEETVMLGEAANLADAPDVDGVRIRRVDDAPDRDEAVGAANALQQAIFGAGPTVEETLARLDRGRGRTQFWVAEAGGRVVCAGRLELVPDTEIAGLWGGATHPDWRGRGIYRALTAARARATLEAGYRYVHSDCTPMSRPILERSGLAPVTTTTPYVWRR